MLPTLIVFSVGYDKYHRLHCGLSLCLMGYNDSHMISIEEALDAVIKNTPKISSEIELPVEEAGNSILSQDVISPINMPPFRQSAMDGYAVNLHEGFTYSITGKVKAGDDHQPLLNPGEAIRIFTGAPVPDSTNAVVVQEKTTVNARQLILEKNPLKGDNIRPLGEQVKKGGLALKEGTKLTPAAIGYLSSLGIKEVPVYKKPSIAIVTTGNELTEAGRSLEYGKIYESNSAMLKSAILNLGLETISIHKVEDDYDETFKKLQDVITRNDLVIITGGISVGDYDFVGRALKELTVKEVFYKVNQKPGKPLFFGKHEQTTLFALPGNPAAALTCFYIYVQTALLKMTGKNFNLNKVMATSRSDFFKNGDRPQFLKAIYKEGEVSILEGQSSAMLQTFSIANALVKMPGNVEQIKVNDKVEVNLLPV